MKKVLVLILLGSFFQSIGQNTGINKITFNFCPEKIKMVSQNSDGSDYSYINLRVHTGFNIQYYMFFESGFSVSLLPLLYNYSYTQKIHIMPFITKTVNYRINIYLSARCLTTHNTRLNDKFAEKSVFRYDGLIYGLGGTYSFNNKWSAYYDYMRYPNPLAHCRSFVQLGVSYAWDRKKQVNE